MSLFVGRETAKHTIDQASMIPEMCLFREINKNTTMCVFVEHEINTHYRSSIDEQCVCFAKSTAAYIDQASMNTQYVCSWSAKSTANHTIEEHRENNMCVFVERHSTPSTQHQ
jgi:hypothetical protein